MLPEDLKLGTDHVPPKFAKPVWHSGMIFRIIQILMDGDRLKKWWVVVNDVLRILGLFL
jgi:hypothetical protein